MLSFNRSPGRSFSTSPGRSFSTSPAIIAHWAPANVTEKATAMGASQPFPPYSQAAARTIADISVQFGRWPRHGKIQKKQKLELQSGVHAHIA